MLRKISVAIVGTMVALSAFAVDLSSVKQTIPLTDGSTVYVFKDGKMGMEDKSGRATRMKPGHVMVATDGTRLTMVGDEVIRLDTVLGRQPRD